jgi:quercetin 2,3-dioxygenase
MKFVARKSQDRGNADHGWLKTFHTFSFAMYVSFVCPFLFSHIDTHFFQIPNWRARDAWTSMRHQRRSRSCQEWAWRHSHREFEILSYAVAGGLEQCVSSSSFPFIYRLTGFFLVYSKDSMGNTEILRCGDLQLTSAGTGISHSEKAHGPNDVHFLQTWSLPSTSRLQPKYFAHHFTDEEKTDKWARVVAPVGADGVLPVREGEGPAPVQSPLTLYATLLGQNKSLSKPLTGKKGYVHVVQTSGYNKGESKGANIKIASKGGEELTLGEGDGALWHALHSLIPNTRLSNCVVLLI